MNNTLQLRSALLSGGFTVSKWARDHGFNQRTVSRVIHTWLDRPDERPRGFKTRAILKQLSQTLGVQLNPSV